MSQVTFNVGDKNYTIACAEGEETQVVKLAAMVDQKLKALGDNVSASPAQNMLFAALLLADELKEAGGAEEPAKPVENGTHELKLELDAIRTERDEALRELALLRQASEEADQVENSAFSVEWLERLADHLEKRAEVLEAKASAS